MDREKVIKGWECHMEADTLGCEDCPYRQGWRTCNFADTLFKDVYAMLKEQEAVVPVYTTNSHPFHIGILYRCGNCHHSLIRYEDLFCRHCGKPIDGTKKAVKWDE